MFSKSLGGFGCLRLKFSVHFKQVEDGIGNEMGDPAFGLTPW